MFPLQVKETRAQEVMEVQQEISYEKNQEKIGKIFKTIVDKKESGRYIGRTEFDSVEVDNEVIIKTTSPLKIGSFVSGENDQSIRFRSGRGSCMNGRGELNKINILLFGYNQ